MKKNQVDIFIASHMNEQRAQQHITVCVFKRSHTKQRDRQRREKKKGNRSSQRNIHRAYTLHSTNEFYLVWYIILQSKVKSSQSKQTNNIKYTQVTCT